MEKLIKDIKKRSPEYGAIPFWSWNDKLEENERRSQIRTMKELGMGHDRYTLVDIDHDDAPILPAQAVQDVTPFAPDGQE